MNIRRIMVGLDFDPSSRRALDFAVDFASKLGADVIALHAFEGPARFGSSASAEILWELGPKLFDAARTGLEELVSTHQGRGVSIESVLVEGDPVEVLERTATEKSADLVILGTHGRRGIARALLGSVAAEVVRGSRIPVLVVPPTGA